MRQRDIMRLRHNDEVLVQGRKDKNSWYLGFVLGNPYREGCQSKRWLVDVWVPNSLGNLYREDGTNLKMSWKKLPRRTLTLDRLEQFHRSL